MKYIDSFKEGMRISDVYLCKNKQVQLTKSGKEYFSLLLQDKTGTVDGKVWEPASPGISDFDVMDYVALDAEITMFNHSLQLNVKRIRKAREGEYVPADYLPVSSHDIESMYSQFLEKIDSVKNPYLHKLLVLLFVEDKDFAKRFKASSAAKNIHHSFMGGLLEHTLSVCTLCEFFCTRYPLINHDLLITAALCHDIGKTAELSPFPENDYTDEGQLLGHIVIGNQIIRDKSLLIDGFPKKLFHELSHCILSHHGELEYGSPKKPALLEAFALNLADNTDAKLQTVSEIMKAAGSNSDWLGYNRMLETNLRRTDKI